MWSIAATGTVAAQAGAADGSRGVIVLRPTPVQAAPAPVTGQPALVSTTPIVAQPAAPALTTAATTLPAAGRPSAPSPLLKQCPRPFDHVATSTAQAGKFNRTLATALRRKPVSAIVDVSQPYKVGDDTPAMLAPWLAQVKASGGIVSAQEYCRDTRGLFSFLRRILGGNKQAAFKSVDGYDAVLHVDGLDQKVTQVEFRRRAL